MKRNVWEFPYTADKLLGAATVKRDHHNSRLSFWDGKKAETLETIKASGLSVDESIADLTSSSYGRNPTVAIDSAMMRDLQECVGKVREHREKVAEYAAWIEVFSSQGQSSFPLHSDDWQFFFGQ